MMRRALLGLWLLAVATTLPLSPPRAALAAEAVPRETIRLSDLGNADTTLRGRFVSADYYLPGPGDYRLAATGSTVELQYSTSSLISPDSVMTVLWNGIPLSDRLLEPTEEKRTWTIPIPGDRVVPGVNRLQVQGSLRLRGDDCVADDDLARHLTIYQPSGIRYKYADLVPHPVPVAADLSRYPWPFFDQNPITPADVVFLLPTNPTSAVLDAAAGISAQLGQFAGGSALVVRAATDTGAIPTNLAGSNLVYVGRAADLPGLSSARALPLSLASDGTFTLPDATAAAADTGVIMEYPSPANPARMVLAVTGTTDTAVAKAARTLSARGSASMLNGSYALIAAIESGPASSAEAEEPALTLAELGRSDDMVTGVGDHILSFKLDVPGTVSGKASVPLDLVLSHSPLLDLDRSSARVTLNGVPLTASIFRDQPSTHAALRVDLPPAAINPGQNAVEVRFSLYTPPLRPDCGRIPTEQAWAVLHADTSVRFPNTLLPAADANLSHYPYPFVKGGHLDQTTIVAPQRLEAQALLLQLVADLGRYTRGGPLTPHVVAADALPETPPDADYILLGTPSENPVLARLGQYLPVAVDQEQRTRFTFTRDLNLTVRDDVDLGILQEIASPWAPNRSILVVSATSEAMLPFSVTALNRPGPAGNLALISQNLTPPAATDEPREPVQVSTYRLKPQQQAPVVATAAPPPPLPIPILITGGIALLALAGAFALAYQAFVIQRREDR